MATYNRPPWQRTLTALKVAGQALLLVALAAIAYGYVLIADAMINAPEPETRCFTAADRTQDYCRTQGDW